MSERFAPSGRFKALLLWWLPLCLLLPARSNSQEGDARAAIRQSLDRGSYAEAEQQAIDLCSQIEAKGGPDSLELVQAQDLLIEALVLNGKASAATTLALAERAVRLKRDRLGNDDLETASALHNLGIVRAERGEFSTAVQLHEEGLAIRRRALGSENPAIADSLDRLALPLIELQRFDEARQRLGESQAIREARAGQSPLDLARTLELMALLHRESGDYAMATPLLDRALNIRQQISRDHPELASALQLRGDVLWLGGDIETAQRTWTEAEGLAERTLRQGHPSVASILRRLALAADAFGNVDQGRRLRERALALGESSLAPCHPEMPGFLNDLALSLKYYGEYAEARKLYERAHLRLQECFGPNHSQTVEVIYNEADLAQTMSDYEEAKRLYKQAIDSWSAGLGRNHPYVARALGALAGVFASEGQYARARSLYQRALEIYRGIRPDHPRVAWTLTSLAQTSMKSGATSAALRDVNEAISIYERSGASGVPDYIARVLALRAEIEVLRGDPASARTTLLEVLQTRERIFGKSHPLVAQTRAEIASVDFTLGANTIALEEALDAERVGRQHLQATLRYLPEHQSLAYSGTGRNGLDLAMSIAPTDSGANGDVLDALVRGRALVLDEMAARRHVSRDAAAGDLASLWTALTSARQRLANLVVRGPSGQPPDQYLKLVNDARTEKEAAERALAEKSASFRDEFKRGGIGLDDVRAALPATSALVAFARYDRTIVSQPMPQSTRHRRIVASYVAFVISAGRADIAMVPLGSASVIDSLVARWHEQATGVLRADSEAEAEQAYRLAGVALRTRIWDPLEPHLKDAATVFVVPDDTLNLVSLASLPVGRKSYLIDSGPIIHYLSAERDLVTNPTAPTSNRGLLAVGGAAFDDPTLFTGARTRTSGTAGASAKLAAAKTRSGCGDLQSLQFVSLAETSDEVRDVARLWTDPPVQVLQNRNASERAFKEAAPGHRVLHLATHGFFLGANCESGPAATRGIGGLSGLPKGQANLGTTDNPLLLSGLALAGANRRAAAGPNDEDGILTAEEVAGLNLEGVEWAVLSACRTGLGEVKIGEGVFGLRRAFQIAGVHTVIISLWSVEDQSAREWMRALYEGRLKQNLSTAEAVQRASLTVLHARRSAKQSTHPFYWAGFVAAGDWR